MKIKRTSQGKLTAEAQLKAWEKRGAVGCQIVKTKDAYIVIGYKKKSIIEV